MDQLNSELLRTFLAIAEAGSVTDGAARIHRSQSAASLQIKRLEDIVGQAVFDRHGRGVVLTAAGQKLLPVARDVARTLDSTLREMKSDDVQGKLRLGIPDDQSKGILAQIVAEFVQSHPRVELEVTCAISIGFENALSSGSLDLAIYEVAHPKPDAEVLRKERTRWMMTRHQDLLSRDVIPVALFDRDCWWRDAALSSLEALGRPYRITYSSQSVAGVAAAIEAGVAIGLLGETSQTAGLEPIGAQFGFSKTPESHLILGGAGDDRTPALEAMQEAVRNAFLDVRHA